MSLIDWLYDNVIGRRYDDFAREPDRKLPPNALSHPSDAYRDAMERKNRKEETAMALIKEEEPKALAAAEQDRVRYRRWYERNFNSFTYSFKVYGTFLYVELYRDWGVFGGPKKEVEAKNKFATTINLMNVERIDLFCGEPPNENGALSWHYQERFEDGEWVPMVFSRQIHTGSYYRCSFLLVKDEWENRGSSNFIHVTNGYPSPGSDDLVHFVGTEITLCVPAGKGLEVRAAIHQAMAKAQTTA